MVKEQMKTRRGCERPGRCRVCAPPPLAVLLPPSASPHPASAFFFFSSSSSPHVSFLFISRHGKHSSMLPSVSSCGRSDHRPAHGLASHSIALTGWETPETERAPEVDYHRTKNSSDQCIDRRRGYRCKLAITKLTSYPRINKTSLADLY